MSLQQACGCVASAMQVANLTLVLKCGAIRRAEAIRPRINAHVNDKAIEVWFSLRPAFDMQELAFDMQGNSCILRPVVDGHLARGSFTVQLSPSSRTGAPFQRNINR